MRAGELIHRVEIQAPSRSQNSMGEGVETYNTIATVWAKVTPLSGSRLFEAQQANSTVNGVVYMRYRRNMQPTFRLLFGIRILKIVSMIDTGETHRELQIMYKEELD